MRPHTSSDEAHRIAFGFSPPDDSYFSTRLRDGLGERGRKPRRSRTEREQRAGQAAEEVGFGTCRGERKANAARGLDDTGSDFQETKTQRRELGSGQFPGFGNGVAHGQHQPISGGVEHEADLVGKRRTAAGGIGGELCFMQLDQILGLAARAIQAVVDPLGRADIEAGDDEADVEAERGRLNTGDGTPFAIPGVCLVAGLVIAAQNSQVLDGASRADVVSGLVGFSGERLGTGQTEDVVDAVVLAPRHRLRPGIVPVATERNSRLVPPRPDVPYQAAQMGAHLDAARGLAGPQHNRHGLALLRVVDVDRQEAAFVILRVEQRELLGAVIDLAQWIYEEFRITVAKQTLSRELRAMGYRKLSARPRHHAQAEGAIEDFKKSSQRAWMKSRAKRRSMLGK